MKIASLLRRGTAQQHLFETWLGEHFASQRDFAGLLSKCLADGRLLPYLDGLDEAAQYTNRRGEDADAPFVSGVFLGDGRHVGEEELGRREEVAHRIAEEFGKLLNCLVGGVGDVGDGKAIRASGRSGVEVPQHFAHVFGGNVIENVLQSLGGVGAAEDFVAEDHKHEAAFVVCGDGAVAVGEGVCTHFRTGELQRWLPHIGERCRVRTAYAGTTPAVPLDKE